MCFLFSAFTQRKVHGFMVGRIIWLVFRGLGSQPNLAACPMNLMNSSNSETWRKVEFLDVNTQLVGGWTNPIWKICSSKWINSPRFGVKNTTYLKPPPSSMRFQPWSLHLHQPLDGLWSLAEANWREIGAQAVLACRLFKLWHLGRLYIATCKTTTTWEPLKKKQKLQMENTHTHGKHQNHILTKTLDPPQRVRFDWSGFCVKNQVADTQTTGGLLWGKRLKEVRKTTPWVKREWVPWKKRLIR